MINKVELVNFKKFKNQVFELRGNIVLAGPNNSGKSTLIQAIAVWNLALKEWLQERSNSKAQVRTGVQLARSKFTAIPLREMNLLWNDRATGKRKTELTGEEKLGTPRPLEIRVTGEYENTTWFVGMAFSYRYRDLVLIKPTDDTNMEDIAWVSEKFSLLFVPSFSGIGINETRYDSPYQEMLIGQGKPGDIIRNRMLEIWQNRRIKWGLLVEDIQNIFGYTLLPPQYEGQPFIICEYIPEVNNNPSKSHFPVLDIASAGSGFLQVVLLLSFFYSKDSAIVLFDEPDAHLHIVLQRQVYDKIRAVANQTRSQLIIATHSEVVVDNTYPENIMSFYREPHILASGTEAEQLREALKQLTSMDLLQADRWPNVLYLEGNSDFNLLREWSMVLKHPLSFYFTNEEKNLFWHNNVGRTPKNAKDHLFALKAVKPDISGVLLLDGDNRKLTDHELRADGLEIIRWTRYEAENYLLNIQTLERFITGKEINIFTQLQVEKLKKFIEHSYFLNIVENPFEDDDAQISISSGKKFLPSLFDHLEISISKNEYYMIARLMKPEEIHPEIIQKLDFIYDKISKK